MTSGPTITCVMPTYRRPALLRRALNSALNQTYGDIRVCVYDNASGDDTEAVAREYASRDPRVEYFRHPENIGPQANLAFGVSRVETPLFSILCDDDAQLPRFYAAGVEALEAHPEAMFYCGRTIIDHRIFRAFRHASLTWRPGVYSPSESTIEQMIRDHFIVTGVLFRSAIRDSVGSFAEHASDKSYLISAAATAPFVVREEEQAVFTIHEKSFSGGVSAEDDRSPHDAVYVLQIFRDAVAGLGRTPFPALPNSRLRRALSRNARREVLYSAGFQSIPLGRWAIIGTILGMADELEIPLATRAMLRVLRVVGRIPIARAVAGPVIAAISGALSRYRAASGANPEFERKVAAYLAGGCTDASLFR